MRLKPKIKVGDRVRVMRGEYRGIVGTLMEIGFGRNPYARVYTPRGSTYYRVLFEGLELEEGD